MKYYYITSIENKEKTIKEGLKSPAGQFYLFAKKSLANSIAYNQLMTESYSLFEVNPKAFEDELDMDDLAAARENHEIMVIQNEIAPKHLKYLGDKHNNIFDLAENENFKLGLILGRGDAEYAREYVERIVVGNKKWLKYYNQKYGLNLLPSVT